jgi:solute carrier family 41
MSAACLSSALLGSFMCALVLGCHKYGLDPGKQTFYSSGVDINVDFALVMLDNIAPPIASCLGDLVTLCLLAGVSYLYINLLHMPFILVILIVAIFVGAIGWAVLTNKNPYVKPLLREGWSPLFGAMIISSGTGAVLDLFVSQYMDYGLLAVANTSGFRTSHHALDNF